MVGKDFLQSHSLFGGITDEQIEEIIPLLEEEDFAKGDFIFNEGEQGDRLYLICKGSVEVVKDTMTPEGKVAEQLAILAEGDTFGEMEIIDIQNRSASIRALEAVSAVSLSNADMYTLYKLNAKLFAMIIMNMAREISRRLRKMDIVMASSLYSAEQKGVNACRQLHYPNRE